MHKIGQHDDDIISPEVRRNLQKMSGERQDEDVDTKAVSFGIIGTRPQLGVTYVDGSGKPVMLPYSWLSMAKEGDNGSLIIEYANDMRVIITGRGLCRPYRSCALDYLRQHRLSIVEVTPASAAEFAKGNEPVVTSIIFTKIKECK